MLKEASEAGKCMDRPSYFLISIFVGVDLSTFELCPFFVPLLYYLRWVWDLCYLGAVWHRKTI